jgi:hypothetical protein
MTLTAPQIQLEGFREGNFSISYRKLNDHFLIAHYVASNQTQTENSNYYTSINSRSFSVFSVQNCALVQNTLIRIFMYNIIFPRRGFLQLKGLYFIPYKRQTKNRIKCHLILQQRYDKDLTCKGMI